MNDVELRAGSPRSQVNVVLGDDDAEAFNRTVTASLEALAQARRQPGPRQERALCLHTALAQADSHLPANAQSTRAALCAHLGTGIACWAAAG